MADSKSGAHPLDFLLNNRGALYEGDLFDTLRSSELVARSFEFSLADGAISCDLKFELDSSFAKRFRKLYRATYFQTGAQQPTRLILFDVKGKRGAKVGAQASHTSTTEQSRHVAFFVGMCAPNTFFAEIIPNYNQDAEALLAMANEIQAGGRDAEEEEGSVPTPPDLTSAPSSNHYFLYNSRIARMPPSAYGIDPGDSPYRLPLALLGEAIRRIRECALSGKTYINPWTKVAFPDWRPLMTDRPDFLRPAPRTQHFTSSVAITRIHEAIVAKTSSVPLEFDFVGLQPRIGDFKLLYPDYAADEDLGNVSSTPRRPPETAQTATRPPPRLQRFIQHKRDGNANRARKMKFDRSRFDFLFYQFGYSDGSEGFFFIPECELPDDFYTTREKEGDFEPFRERFYIDMSDDLAWVDQMYQMILAYPQPRRRESRPVRRPATSDEVDPDGLLVELPQDKGGRPDPTTHARHRYARTLNQCQQQFFDRIMTQCALELSGVLLILVHDHPLADFLFCRYSWTLAEQRRYLESRKPPMTIDYFRGDTPVVPVLYLTRALEISFTGPTVRTSSFLRLDAEGASRLIVWNLWGSDDNANQINDAADTTEEDVLECGSLIVVPSEDFRPTEAQRLLYRRNAEVETRTERPAHTPDVSALLGTGVPLAEYAVGSAGHRIYEQGCDWSAMCRLLRSFTERSSVEHPMSFSRTTRSYRLELAAVHQRLIRQHQRDAR
ncbi:hypothetical protein KC349_g3000 [Hortaea werneckii]|nr:hypothetical protein KC349_g3000 [Hortaea werneckii]